MPVSTFASSYSEAGNRIGTTFLKGSGNGTSYSTTSTSYVAVDQNLLQCNVIVPRGFNLAVQCGGVVSISGGTNQKVALAIIDVDPQNGQPNLNYAQDECILILPNSSTQQFFGLTYLFEGGGPDGVGLSHQIILAYKVISAGGNAVQILNDTPAHCASMQLTLSPSLMNGSGQTGSPAAPWA